MAQLPAAAASEASVQGAVTKLPSLRVEATQPFPPRYRAPVASTATLTDTPVSLTPAAIQVVPAAVLQDQQVTRIDKALDNVSGVYTQKSGIGDISFYSLRGFSTYDGSTSFLYRDGIRADYAGGNGAFPDLANIERIEVLKGPASILYGRIEPGGMINMVTKKPEETPSGSVEQKVGSYRFLRTTLNATGPIVKQVLLGRIDAAYENRREFQDFVRGDRIFLAPQLQLNLGEHTELRAYLDYLLSHDGLPDTVPSLGGRPVNIPRSRNLGDPANGQLDMHDTRMGLTATHRFNPDWKLRATFDARLNSGFLKPGLYNSGIVDPDNCTGEDCAVGRTLQANFGKPSRAQGFHGALDITGHVETFSLRHTLLVGADYFHSACCGKGNGFATSTDDPATIPPPTDLHRPTYSGISADLVAAAIAASSASTTAGGVGNWLGLYAQDQVEFPRRVHLLAGMRYNYASSYDLTTHSSTSKDGRVLPRVGLLWQAIDEIAVYGSYVQNFGASNGRTDQGFPKPQFADQWEVGVKSDLFDARVHATLAAYTIDKRNSLLPDPDLARAAMGFVVPIGEVRNRGLELDVSADITPEWQLIASYSWIDSKILKDRVVDEMGEPQPDNTGHRLFGVPAHGGSFWTKYELPESSLLHGLRAAAGIVARSQQYASNDNDVRLHGYALVNAMLAYSRAFGPAKLTLQLNVDNLLDATYYVANGFASGTSAASYFGAPRTFLASLRGEL